MAAASCGHVEPTAPTPFRPAPVVTTVSRADATGQVVDASNPSAGIAAVMISGTGTSTAYTDSSGFFTVTTPGSTFALLLWHPDFVERRTAAVLPATGLHFSMIPSTFDRVAFEELAPRSTSSGLRRWIQQPSLVVLTNIVEYDPVRLLPRVTDRAVAPGDFTCMLDGVRNAIGSMSDGTLRFKSVEVVAAPVDSRFSISDTPEGTIVLMTARGVGANGRAGAIAGSRPNIFVRGAIWIDSSEFALCGTTAARVYPHELGHALGYEHVTMASSIMSGVLPTPTLTAFDRDAFRIIYQRPPGNRAPDIDPPDYVINASLVPAALSSR